VVVVAELLVEVRDDRRIPPPRDRDEEVIDQTDYRNAGGRPHDGPNEWHQVVPAQDEGASEEIRPDRNEIVLQREPDRAAVGRPVEPALRQDGVDANEDPEHERENVRSLDAKREPPLVNGIERDAAERNCEQDLLPGLECGQSAPPHTRAVQRGHDRVVHGKPDNPRIERDRRLSPDQDRDGNEQEPVHREREPRSHQVRVNLSGDARGPRLSMAASRPRDACFPLLPP
jgi:hypothetical protein